MQRLDPETLGLMALAWLAADAAQLQRFLDVSGLDPADLRTRASEPEMLAAVMDYLLSVDALLAQFCADQGLKPEDVHRARAKLPGGTHETSV